MTRIVCRTEHNRSSHKTRRRLFFIGSIWVLTALSLSAELVAWQDIPASAKALASVPRELAQQAAAAADKEGAQWKLQLAPPERRSDDGDRKSGFWLDGAQLFAPTGEWLLEYRLSDGKIATEAIRCPFPIGQVVGARRGIGFAFTCRSTHDEREMGDIMLFMRRQPEIKLLSGHDRQPSTLVFSPDGSRLVSFADDAPYRLWDTNSGTELRQAKRFSHRDNTNSGEFLAFSHDGKWLATAYQHTIVLRRPTDGLDRTRWRLYSQQFYPTVLRFAPIGCNLFAFAPSSGVTGNTDRFVEWKIADNTPTGDGHISFEGTRVAAEGVFTPNGKQVATGTSGRRT